VRTWTRFGRKFLGHTLGMRLLAICMVAAAGSVLAACGDDDDGVTVPTVTVEVAPTESATTTTPPASAEEATPDPSSSPPASPPGEDAPGKPKGSGGKGGGHKVDLPKCSEIGEGPAKCRREDGTVRVPERL
jgi:hypothetical protein